MRRDAYKRKADNSSFATFNMTIYVLASDDRGKGGRKQQPLELNHSSQPLASLDGKRKKVAEERIKASWERNTPIGIKRFNFSGV